MKASVPAANKCRNFSSSNKATLLVGLMPVVVAQVKVAQVEVKAVEDKADLVPVVDAQVKVAPDKAGLAKVALDRLIP